MEICINGIFWLVKNAKSGSYELQRDNGTITIGMTDKDNHIIFIDENLDYDLKSRVIIHELCHAYLSSYNYYIEDVKTEELMCDFISSYLYDIIDKRNYILRYL